VLVERYRPGWTLSATPGISAAGDVEIELHDLARRDAILAASVTYRAGPWSWTQRFTAAEVDDDGLAHAAGVVGLEPVRALDAERTWVLLRPRQR
jgi:hypothetical protein